MLTKISLERLIALSTYPSIGCRWNAQFEIAMFDVLLAVIEAISFQHLSTDGREGAIASNDQIGIDFFRAIGCRAEILKSNRILIAFCKKSYVTYSTNVTSPFSTFPPVIFLLKLRFILGYFSASETG
jgi:hypothetical protein